MRVTLLAAAVAMAMASAHAETILKEDFEHQGKWKKVIKGKGSAELVPGGVEGKCLKVVSVDKALVYYVLPLDAKRVRGKHLIVTAKVKLENVVQGDHHYAKAKLKLMIHEGKKPINRAYNFDGNQDWHDRVLTADVGEAATRVELQLGIQNGTGAAYYDSLVVQDDVMEHVAVSLKTAANGSHNGTAFSSSTGRVVPTAIDLSGLPPGYMRAGEVDFQPLSSSENFGRACIVLRGKRTPLLPAAIEAVMPVGTKAKRLFFLHAALDADPSRKEPCIVYEVRYQDGKSLDAPMREGVDVGDLSRPQDLPNWKVGWTSKRGEATMALGVSEWTNPRPQAKIAHIRVCTPGTGATPVVVAISLDPIEKP